MMAYSILKLTVNNLLNILLFSRQIWITILDGIFLSLFDFNENLNAVWILKYTFHVFFYCTTTILLILFNFEKNKIESNIHIFEIPYIAGTFLQQKPNYNQLQQNLVEMDD